MSPAGHRWRATAMAGVSSASTVSILILCVSLAAGAKIRKYRQVIPSFHADLLDTHVTSVDLSNVVYSFACAAQCSRNSCCRLACRNGSECQLYDIKVADYWPGLRRPYSCDLQQLYHRLGSRPRPILPTNLSTSSVSEGSDTRKSVDGFIGNENASYPNGSLNQKISLSEETRQLSPYRVNLEAVNHHKTKTKPNLHLVPTLFRLHCWKASLGRRGCVYPEEPVSGRYLSLQSLDLDPANVLTICHVEILEQQREPVMSNVSGVYTVYPKECCPVSVYCDMDTDGGGWTVIQQRRDALPREDFYRPWSDYALGFGHSPCGEFWLGLEHIHALADQRPNELRIDLEDLEGKTRWAKYRTFYVGDRDDLYALGISRYEGNAGDAMAVHDGNRFSTKDYDNDKEPRSHCAQMSEGGWWYSSPCHYANLNGKYLSGSHKSVGNGINWYQWHGNYYSLKSSTMMIRPAP
ncbi:LOW QUALITY PROTEIN: uncharacterized protein LOC119571575 [Penaeus monodon]|uniref:LOW QUALITY PROTEIN: uncharacterized protein LOC119571575 n=1 Tax=Penaeus monodon TaxID=6687 RepID=UPI0018A6E476|nr:LOW QUALITY PROTEIN: uncharacterized protein LOC119571575 [Penaeus monodon]